MTKFLCVLALLVVVAKAAPSERTFHLAGSQEPVDATADEAVEDNTLRTHVGLKTIKKVFVKTQVPVVAAHAHPHEHNHDAAVHPPHAQHLHPHLSTTPAPVEDYVPAYAPPPAPVAVVLDNNPLYVDNEKITAILKKLLSGAVNQVAAYGKPLVVPPGGKPVAVIFSAGMHVIDLATLQTLVSAHADAAHPSYDASNVKVEVVKLAAPDAAYPAKAKPVVVTSAKYAAPAVAVKEVVAGYGAAAVKTPSYPAKAYAAAAAVAAPAYAAKALAAAPVTTPGYAAAVEVAPVEYAAPAPTVKTLHLVKKTAYPAAAAAVPAPAPKAYAAAVVPAPSYAAPAEVEVAADDVVEYAPAPVLPIKPVTKVVVAKDDY